METTTTQPRTVHCFEEAGLGIAPFTVDSVIFGNWETCEFCSTAIKERCYIKDCHNKIFLVGNECVKKTGDRGLVDVVRREVNRLRTEARHKKEAEKIFDGEVLLRDEKVINILTESTTPNGRVKMLDYIKNRLKWSGNKGKIETMEVVKEYAAKVLTTEELQFYKDNREAFTKKFEEEKRLEREAVEAENNAKIEAYKVQSASMVEKHKELLEALYALEHRSSFVLDMIAKLKCEAFKNFSLRQQDVLIDIYGKQFGNRNSKDYKNAVEHIKNAHHLNI